MRSRVKIPVDGEDEEEEKKGSEPVAQPKPAPTPAPATGWTPAPGYMDQTPTTQTPEHVKASIDQLSNMNDSQMEQMVN